MQTYLDFHLEVGGDHRIRARFTPEAGAGHSESGGQMDLTPHQQEIKQLGRQLAEKQAGRSEIEALGAHLFTVLFPPQVGAHYQGVLREAMAKPDRGLRLRLTFDEAADPDLATWPWEVLYCPGDDFGDSYFLATHPRLVISRYRPLRQSPPPLTLEPGEKLKVLVVTADPAPDPPPDGLGPVVYQPVWEALVKLVRRNPQMDMPELIKDVSLVRLDATLERVQPHIVHFIGHGRFKNGQGALAFAMTSGLRGAVNWVVEQDVAAIFQRWAEPGVVLLHACESGQSSAERGFVGVASRVVQGNVPVVVAMRYSLSNLIAIEFARAFYTRLAAGVPVDAAVQEGRRTLALGGPGYETRDFAVPMLYMRVNDGQIFRREEEVVTPVEWLLPAADEICDPGERRLLERLEMQREQGNLPGMAASLARLARLYEDTDRERARLCYERSIEILESIGDKNAAARGLRTLGTFHAGLNHPEEAMHSYRRSLQLARLASDRKEEALTLAMMGRWWWAARHSRKGAECRQKAIAYWEQSLPMLQDLGLSEAQRVERWLQRARES